MHRTLTKQHTPTAVATMPPTTMYYDGACSLCRREVNHYRRLDGAGRVRWIDISSQTSVLDAEGIQLPDAMARLHVRDGRGQLHTGAWAFAALWAELPYYRWLSRLLRSLGLLGLINIIYDRFARWRLVRRGCQNRSCQNP